MLTLRDILATTLMFQTDTEPQNIRVWARRFLEQLPPLNYNLFVYLMSFERELLKYEAENRYLE